MLPIYYFSAFVLSFFVLIICIAKSSGKNKFVLLGSACVLLTNAGYYTLSISFSMEEALLAYKITYTGCVFLPLVLLLGIIEICNIKIPSFLPFVLVLISTGLLLVIYSIGYLDIYYKSAALVRENNTSYLTKEYGPLHILLLIYLASYIVVMSVIIFNAFRRGNEISYKYAIALIVIVVINTLAYCIERVFEMKTELLAFTFLVSEIISLYFLQRRKLFGIDSVANRAFAEGKEAFFVIDNNGHYMGRSNAAAEILPELSDLKLEMEIPKKSLFLNSKIQQFLNPQKDDSVADSIFFRNGREYRISSKALYGIGRKRKEIIGTVLILQDDTKQQRYMRLMTFHNEELAKDVEQKTDHIRVMHDKLIFGMADMVESRDPNTGGHIKRTSGVVKLLTSKLLSNKSLGLTNEFLSDVAKAAPMHDLGKISIDDSILRKPGLFTRDEYECMKKHAAKGAEIVSQIVDQTYDENFFKIAVNVAHYHHEKWDGTGYPDNLRGEQIPVEARIVALADVFDALVSKRCYKEAFSFEKAFEIIEDSLGTQFSPEIGRVFLECKEELIHLYTNDFAEA